MRSLVVVNQVLLLGTERYIGAGKGHKLEIPKSPNCAYTPSMRAKLRRN